MTNHPYRITDAPANLKTARRPGQPGEQTEHRAGPNPRSAHPTGPHAPYDPNDPDGIAAEKHYSESAPVPASADARKSSLSENIKIIDTSKP